MAGWTVVPNNLALLGKWYVCTSRGTVDSSYPVNNLNDWHHWNQTWVASADVGGTQTVTLKYYNASPTLVADWDVSGLGIVNHNTDGMTWVVTSTSGDSDNATDNSAGGGGVTATTRATMGLDSAVGNPNILKTITAARATVWYFSVTNGASSFTLKLGNIVMGPAFDLGYPNRPETLSMQPTGGIRTETGVSIQSRVIDPMVTKSLTFSDPTYMTKTAIYDRTGASGSSATYNNLFRHFAYAKGVGHAGGWPTYTGITAGSGIPCLYHEGTNNGLSGVGRPAFYGNWNLGINRNDFRTISSLNVTITDAIPRGSDIVPTSN